MLYTGQSLFNSFKDNGFQSDSHKTLAYGKSAHAQKPPESITPPSAKRANGFQHSTSKGKIHLIYAQRNPIISALP